MRRPRLPRSRSLRKRLMHTLLIWLALALTIFSVGTWFSVNTVLMNRTDHQLDATAKLLDSYAQQTPAGTPLIVGGGADTTATATTWHEIASTGLLPVFIQFRGLDGSITFNPTPASAQPTLPKTLSVGAPGTGADGDGAILFDADGTQPGLHSPSYRVRASRLPNEHGFLVLAMSEQDITNTMASVGKIEISIWLVAFLLVGLMSNARIRRQMKPFERMGDRIVAIGAGELDHRVEPDDPHTEIGRVGSSVNTMLGRLEHAFGEQRASEDRLRRFIADASHELRTPLASIRGYAELFRRGAASRPEDLALAMRRIESESTRMGVLVDELLLLARLDSGRPLGRGRVDVGALARDAARDSHAADPQWPVEVTVADTTAGDERVEVCGDADRLRQLLANLLSNVRAHTPAGTPAWIAVRRDEDPTLGDCVVIEVEDAGPGLTPEQQARVFERFYRADTSRKRGDGAGGSGLGLSIVASVAAAHGGVADVRSLPDCGTVFTVRLPVEGVAAAEDDPVPVLTVFTLTAAPHTAPAHTAPTLTVVSQVQHSASPGRTDSLSDGGAGNEPARESETGRGSGVMDRLSAFTTTHRRWVYLTWLVLFVAGIAAASTLSNHLDKTFSMPGQPSYVANQAIVAEYGTGGQLPPLVSVVRTPAGVGAGDARVSAAFDSVAKIPGTRVADFANTGDRHFVGTDGRTTYAYIFTAGSGGMEGSQVQDQISTKAEQVLNAELPPGSTVRITGEGPLQTNGSSGGLSILNEVLIGAVGALAVLLFVFASMLAFVPLLIAAVSVLTAFLAILGVTEITSVSLIVQFLVGLIGLGVAIDYSLLLVTRWREELAHGHDNATAIRRSMQTAGRAVAFSGLTVALGLLALIVLPVPFLRSIGYGGMIIPLVSVAATLTLVPALLAGIGKRLDWPKIRHEDTASRGWTAWANLVVRRRWIAAVGALVVLGALAFTATGLKAGDASSDALSQSGKAHDGIVMLRDAGISSGVITPLEVLVPQPDSATDAARAASGVPGISFTAAPTGSAWDRPGSKLLVAVPAQESTSSAGEGTTRAVRTALAAVPGAMVGGMGPVEVDMIHAVYGSFPLMLGILGLLTFVLLARAFRSIILPIKAVLLNLLSLAAVYGSLVLIWQKGYLSHAIWNIPATGAITAWIPLMVFAFLFGLSMDYEVFILSRMREEYDATGSTRKAVITGIGRTGRLVTSAALILFLAMAALGSAPDTDVKVFATALGIGILLDATVVRALLVPALISLFGRWNWWMPVWAARILRVEPSPARREDEAPPAMQPELADDPEGASVG